MCVEVVRSGWGRVLVDGETVTICDGCGGLIAGTPGAASSDETLAPAGASGAGSTASGGHSVRCMACGFMTACGGLRKCLGLGIGGGEMHMEAALALLVEGIGAERAVKSCEKRLREEWFLRQEERDRGLEALFGVLGLREEDVVDPAFPAYDPSEMCDNDLDVGGCVDAERFILALPGFRGLPFTVKELAEELPNAKRLQAMYRQQVQEAVECSAELVAESHRLWAGTLQNPTTAPLNERKALLKIRALGAKLRTERVRARMYIHNHSCLGPGWESFRATQQVEPSANQATASPSPSPRPQPQLSVT